MDESFRIWGEAMGVKDIETTATSRYLENLRIWLSER
jgi:hypothetical protein